MASGNTLVIFAAQGARAEAVRTDQTVVPVPLADGGGVLAGGERVRLVRVYDANGALIEERVPGSGLVKVP